jgi:hypothetical protein
MLHAGSARYYSGRLTVRYDLIPPQLFERTIAHFQQQGFVPFLLLDDGERGHFVETNAEHEPRTEHLEV